MTDKYQALLAVVDRVSKLGLHFVPRGEAGCLCSQCDLIAEAVLAKALPDDEPVAYLVERHAFRVSPDGQDAEDHDWLEVSSPHTHKAFPVYTSPQPPKLPVYKRSQEMAAFEEWAVNDGYDLSLSEGSYSKFSTKSAYLAWKAGRAALRWGK